MSTVDLTRPGPQPKDAAPAEAAIETAPPPVEETAAPVPVDNPNTPAPGITIEKRRPVLASWLTTRKDFLATAKHAGANLGYAALYHGLRTCGGVYPARLAVRAPRGFARLTSAGWRWIWDREAAHLRGHAVDTEQIHEYLTLSRKRDHRVRLRGLVTVVAGTLGLGFAITLYVMAPLWLAAFAIGGVLALGYAGQQPDAPVIGPAVLKTEVQKLTGSIVMRALGAIGNTQINAALKKGGDMDGMRFTSEICRDGPGYRADVDLPYGVTPEEVMEKRESLASGLRRKLGCVWPAGDENEHEGRLTLYVGDRPMNETTKPPWPLMKDGTVDLFRPVVFGNDQRMRDVAVTLMFASIVIGSIPRMGKTFLLRLLLLIFALDPRSQLYAFDFKGTGDLGALEPVCHRYRAGEEDEDIEYVLHALRELKAELRRRAKVIKSLPRSVCPESKVTPELASDRSLGLHPIVAALDECFPAGTTVGGRPIESLRPGDMVPSWSESTGQPCNGVVVGTMRKIPNGLIRMIWDNGTALVCTPNHPLMTLDGWRPAGELTPESKVLTYGEAHAADSGPVLDLPDHVHAPAVQARVLQEVRSGDLLAGVPCEVGGSAQRAGAHDEGGARLELSQDDGEQPDAQSTDQGEGVGHVAEDRAQASPAGRQRTWTDGAAEATGRSARLADRGHNLDGAATPWRAAIALQGGHRERGAENRSRGGRRFALHAGATGAGRTEDSVAHWRGVARVEVLEPGSDGRYGGLCPDGHVYNFEVADTHVYRVADGVVAHNCQVPFEHEKYGAELEAICTDITKRGPALGIVGIFATQRPDAKSLPSGISANAVLRFCLKVMGHQANDMVLTTGAHKAGIKATMFSRRDLGICWMSGEGDDPRIVSSAFVDAVAAEKIATRARGLRERYGNITGHAIGQQPEAGEPTFDLLADILKVVAADEKSIWNERIAARLASLRPDIYEGWKGEQVTSALKPHGVATKDIAGYTDDGQRTTRRGIERAHVVDAVTHRDRSKAAA